MKALKFLERGLRILCAALLVAVSSVLMAASTLLADAAWQLVKLICKIQGVEYHAQ
jgi:hypothetical protein